MQKKIITIVGILTIILCGFWIYKFLETKSIEKEKIEEQNRLKNIIIQAQNNTDKAVKLGEIKNYTLVTTNEDSGFSTTKSVTYRYVDVENNLEMIHGEDTIVEGFVLELDRYEKLEDHTLITYTKYNDSNLLGYSWKKDVTTVTDFYIEGKYDIPCLQFDNINNIEEIRILESDIEGSDKYEIIMTEDYTQNRYSNEENGTIIGKAIYNIYIKNNYIIKSYINYNDFLNKENSDVYTYTFEIVDINNTIVTLPKNIK